MINKQPDPQVLTITPQVGTASYYVSLPWTVASPKGGQVVLHTTTPPVCGYIDWGPYYSSVTSVTFTVYAVVLLAHPPCVVPKPMTSIVRSAPTTATLFHVKTGLTVSRYNDTGTFTYYDGTTHTVK